MFWDDRNARCGHIVGASLPATNQSWLPRSDKHETSMRFWTRIAPIVVPFLIIVAVTEALYSLKVVVHAQHLVFFYLLPTAFIAMLYGSVLSMICAIDATLIATLFLYDPGYSLYVSDPRAAGELFLFGLTALIGAKCTAELMQQTEKAFAIRSLINE